MEAIVARELARLYRGKVWGLRNASFSCKNRSITVLLGPNGAGKTTTVRILSTLLKPTRGKAFVLGLDVVRDAWRVRERIAVCPQDVRVDINWSPLEAVKGYLVCRGWSMSDAYSEARRWLEELELWDVRNRPVARLSGGQGKRVAVAMVLASNADVLFLDEPTSGLDVEGRYRVWRALRTTVGSGATILLTTHDMREAEMLGDKIVLISKGTVVAEGTVEQLLTRIPFRHKIIAKNTRRLPEGVDGKIVNLGDRVIIYVESHSEAVAIASEIEAESVMIGEVSLEDAYVYMVEESMRG